MWQLSRRRKDDLSGRCGSGCSVNTTSLNRSRNTNGATMNFYNPTRLSKMADRELDREIEIRLDLDGGLWGDSGPANRERIDDVYKELNLREQRSHQR